MLDIKYYYYYDDIQTKLSESSLVCITFFINTAERLTVVVGGLQSLCCGFDAFSLSRRLSIPNTDSKHLDKHCRQYHSYHPRD